MQHNVLPLTLFAILLTACGSTIDPTPFYPDRVYDSLAIEAHEFELKMQDDTLPAKQAVNTELTDLRQRLAVAEKKLNEISEMKFGMTKSEKEQATIEIVAEIENLKSQIELLERIH